MKRVLVADDDDISLELISHALTLHGYEVTAVSDGEDAFNRIRTGDYQLFVSDWEMPGMTGIELCQSIRQRVEGSYVYTILLTSHGGIDNIVSGLEAGADDFLTKPFQPAELLMRLRVGERILGLESRELTIFALAKLAESRDQDTGEHLERIREYARVIARSLSHHPEFKEVVDGDYINLIYQTSPLHDIGKVAIRDAILLKPGRLTPAEFEVMKTHTLLGAETLCDVAKNHPNATFLNMAKDIALTHHEKFNGTGYPYGLSGDEIPLCGRITAVADVYDALRSNRVYKDAFTHEVARDIILKDSGTHFDPRIVDAFLLSEPEFIRIHQQFADKAPTATADEDTGEIPVFTTTIDDEGLCLTGSSNEFSLG